MRDDEIGQILGGDDDAKPSPGFHDRVMDAIHREATTLPPIPFPWKRAWPAVAASAVVVVGAPVLVAQWLAVRPPVVSSLFAAAQSYGAVWIALATVSTVGSLLLSRRLAEERY